MTLAEKVGQLRSTWLGSAAGGGGGNGDGGDLGDPADSGIWRGGAAA